MLKHISTALATLATVALLAGCQSQSKSSDQEAMAEGHKGHHKMHGEHKEKHKEMRAKMKDAELVAHMKGTKERPQVSGTVNFEPLDKRGLKITGEIRGLKPNTTHGFHVHEYGDCSAPDATSAGGHYNPADAPHNLPDKKMRHAGDFGNIKSNAKGVATIDITDERLTTLFGKFPVAGRGLIVHANPDTGEGDSGEAGARLACGVIGFAKK